ncbi:MAG: amidohydrolase family protein [Gemmataceae bacterium]
MNRYSFRNATLILPDRLVENAGLTVADGRIAALDDGDGEDLGGMYLAPGFVDVHVHGGDGADFMDGTADAFRTVCRCHARHGTTTLTPTSTVARLDQYRGFLETCAELTDADTGGARVAGGHLYGPYFVPEAKGCHPVADFLTPSPDVDETLLAYAGRGLRTLTVAPELPGCERLVRAARDRGLLVTAGHSYATFPQMEAAVGWGVRHIDHLFCAMSDRARLRPGQAFPMRAGVMEATLYFDELTTEVIADGWHLSADLLRLAYKVKGPDRLALVSDAMRAVDCPDGEYWFGPADGGEKVRRLGDVGVTLDGKGLASGVMVLDHCVRTFHRLTGAPLPEVVRMASLTPARILGLDQECGSLEVGKRADFVVLDRELTVRRVYVGGRRVV